MNINIRNKESLKIKFNNSYLLSLNSNLNNYKIANFIPSGGIIDYVDLNLCIYGDDNLYLKITCKTKINNWKESNILNGRDETAYGFYIEPNTKLGVLQII